jgi:hypothetical protein
MQTRSAINQKVAWELPRSCEFATYNFSRLAFFSRRFAFFFSSSIKQPLDNGCSLICYHAVMVIARRLFALLHPCVYPVANMQFGAGNALHLISEPTGRHVVIIATAAPNVI